MKKALKERPEARPVASSDGSHKLRPGGRDWLTQGKLSDAECSMLLKHTVKEIASQRLYLHSFSAVANVVAMWHALEIRNEVDL